MYSTNHSLPLISVILPIYNVEAFLPACIDSILQQRYQHLEIILINDGSPDNCGKISNDYASKDNRIKVIHKQNGGLSDARNAGLDICTGEYIVFIDSDDLVHPQFIEKMYTNIKNSEIIFCDFFSFNKDSETYSNEKKEDIVQTYTPIELLNEHHFFTRPLAIVVWNKLYKRSLWDNLRFPKGKIHEDEFVFHKTIFKAKKINFLNEKLYHYRHSTNSITKNKALAITRKTHHIEALKDRVFFARENLISELEINTKNKLIEACLSAFEDLQKNQVPEIAKITLLEMQRELSLKQKIRWFLAKNMNKTVLHFKKFQTSKTK